MNRLRPDLFRPLDYFAKPQYGKDSLQLARARALVGTNLFIALLLAVAMLFVITAESLGELGSQFIWGLMLPGMMINIAIPFLLRHIGWLAFCQQITLIVTFAAIVIGICTSGGPVLAPNNQLMILQAALSLFLLGIRGGMLWSGIVLLTQSFLYYLFINGVDFPNLRPPEAATAGAIFNWALAFCAIISLILLIELSRGQLEIQRYIEREKLRYMANHDGLTELANRSLFEQRLKEAIEESQQTGNKVLLLYLDLDKFKPINDEYGHDAGDKVLQIVAARLTAATRDQDTVARLGGDEFAMLLPNVDTHTSIHKLSESIHGRITQPIHLQGKYFDVDCSIGISCYPEHANTGAQLWKLADSAMYIAKKNAERWHIHNSDNKVMHMNTQL
ncbi:MAG: diguanylate cyclase (GGDEF)-like protein [Oceanicoccus sp.]|jgi:diguanylate cyclase (GGDEF)-like protein